MAPPLLTFYGDDFTGSSAVTEVLAFAGIPAAMFLDIPSPDLLARLPDLRAIGIAGIARSQSPDWMDRNLPGCFRALKKLGAPILHYKTCSTFDSAPHLGSIGRAIEIGLAETGSEWTPLVVGAPQIGRYQMFGTLFAGFGDDVFRLDRHPVMSRHPATPMHEADLCRHLDAQTSLPKAVIDFRVLAAGTAAARIEEARAAGARILAIDCFDETTLRAAGRVIADSASKRPLFVAGSQGIEYALVAYWRQAGVVGSAPTPKTFGPAAPLLVVSGSCSPTTAAQIAAAEVAGFVLIGIDARRALSDRNWQAEMERVGTAAMTALGERRSVIAATARGPDDSAVAAFTSAMAASGGDPAAVHARIGAGLGSLVRRARTEGAIGRAIIAGGDTSGHAVTALGVDALVPIAPFAPGVPLMRIVSRAPAIDGLEIALKGGQMGSRAIFSVGRAGTASGGHEAS